MLEISGKEVRVVVGLNFRQNGCGNLILHVVMRTARTRPSRFCWACSWTGKVSLHFENGSSVDYAMTYIGGIV